MIAVALLQIATAADLAVANEAARTISDRGYDCGRDLAALKEEQHNVSRSADG